MNMWVYKGRLKMAVYNNEFGRTVIRDLGPSEGQWRLFQHGRNI